MDLSDKEKEAASYGTKHVRMVFLCKQSHNRMKKKVTSLIKQKPLSETLFFSFFPVDFPWSERFLKFVISVSGIIPFHEINLFVLILKRF